jgi:ribosomal-protein-alanine N-acetyltransferase
MADVAQPIRSAAPPWAAWHDLSDERLKLEPLGREHSAGMFALWSHPEVVRHSGEVRDLRGRPIELPAKSASDSDRILEFFLPEHAGAERVRWALIDRDSGSFLGAIGFNAWRPRLELAFHLHPEHWGHGWMRAAAELLLARLDEGSFQAVEAFAESANTRSTGLLLWLGFLPLEEHRDGAAAFLRPAGGAA